MESMTSGSCSSYDKLLPNSVSDHHEPDHALTKAYKSLADHSQLLSTGWLSSINVPDPPSITAYVNWETGEPYVGPRGRRPDFGESRSKSYSLLSHLLHPPPPANQATAQIRNRFPHHDDPKEINISDTQHRLQAVMLDVEDDGNEVIIENIQPKKEQLTVDQESESQNAPRRGMKYLPSVNSEGIFLLINLILEILLVVLEQYSSPRQPHWSLMAAIVSLIAMLVCIIELLDRGRKAKAIVFKRQGLRLRCWFHLQSQPSTTKPLYSFLDMFSLICVVSQLIFSVVAYSFNRRDHNNPIKVSIVSVVFIVCMALSKYTNNRNVVPPPVQGLVRKNSREDWNRDSNCSATSQKGRGLERTFSI